MSDRFLHRDFIGIRSEDDIDGLCNECLASDDECTYITTDTCMAG